MRLILKSLKKIAGRGSLPHCISKHFFNDLNSDLISDLTINRSGGGINSPETHLSTRVRQASDEDRFARRGKERSFDE